MADRLGAVMNGVFTGDVIDRIILPTLPQIPFLQTAGVPSDRWLSYP